MHNTKRIGRLAIMVFVLLTAKELGAQRISTGSRVGSISVYVDYIMVPAGNISILDSVNMAGREGATRGQEGGSLVHLVTFDFTLGTAEGATVLRRLYSAMSAQPLNSVSITFLDSNGQPVSGKTFTSIVITEIQIPELNAASTEVLKAVVLMQAEDVMDGANYGGGGISNAKNSRPIAGNQFSLSVDNLPVQNILRIGSIRLVPPAAHGSYWTIDFEINSTDTGPWSQWISTSNNGGPGKQAIISLPDERGQSGNLSISLTQLEIISVKIQGNLGANATTRVRLRTPSLPVIQ